MTPSSRLNFVPTKPLGGDHLPWLPWTTPAVLRPQAPSWSMLQRCPTYEPPNRAMFRTAFLSLPWDPKHYEAADRLAQQLSIGTGEVSKQMVKWSCSFQSPDDQEDFWKFLEDVQGVKVPWKAGATVTWRIHKQTEWIHFDLWFDPNLF